MRRSWHNFSSHGFVLYARYPISMKYFLIRTLLVAWFGLLGTGISLAQSGNHLAPIGAALRSGSSRGLAQFLAPMVEVGFNGEKQGYNATQAELVVRDFFTKTAPSSFEFIHQGSSEQGIQYAVGRYVSRGTVYRVYLKLKPGKGSPVIDTLEFTKEE